MSEYSLLKEEYEQLTKHCEICNSADLVLFQTNGRVAESGVYGPVPVTICRVCGYKMQNPRYEDAFYEAYYEEMYREVAFGATKPSVEYISQQKERGAGVLHFVQEHEIPVGEMLDHGCASGGTMLSWKDSGWDVVGIDPHRPSVESGRLMGLDIKIAAGEKLPFPDAKFDLILSLGSTEHSYDLGKTMREARRVLREGGFLVIRWRSNEIFGSPLEYYNHNHYRYFTPKTWHLCLASHGFSIEATTDRRLEGWASYSYILAKKQPENVLPNIDEMIAAGIKDDYLAELQHLQELRGGYYVRCSAFLAYMEEHKMASPDQIIESVLAGDGGFEWNFLGGDPKSVVKRANMEAERYVTEFDANRVI